MTVQMARDTFLRTTLYGNVTFSLISGALLALAAPSLTPIIGLPSPWFLIIVGLGVLGFGAVVWQVARQAPMNRTHVIGIAIADINWVIASGLLLLWPGLPLTTEGRWAIAILAEIVAVFAILEIYGLRQARR